MRRTSRNLVLGLAIIGLAVPALAPSAGEPNVVLPPRGAGPVVLGSVGARALVLLTDEDARTIWSSDGTAAGTMPIARFGRFQFVRMSTDRYLYEEVGGGFRYWRTDGTPEGTFPLTAAPLGFFYDPFPGKILHIPETGRRYFAADDGSGPELWMSDGTVAGTRLIIDLVPGRIGSGPREIVAFRNRVLFVADDGRGPSLWSTDGTAAGTRLVADPDPVLRQETGPQWLVPMGTFVTFFLKTPAGWSLFRTDGTTAGTRRIRDLPVTPISDETLTQMIAHNGRLYFLGGRSDGQVELWSSNGTAAGTAPVYVVPAERAWSIYLPFDQPATTTLFVSADAAHGLELWRTDGVPGDARLVKDACPGPCNGVAIVPHATVGSEVLFVGSTPARGNEPWLSDGTSAGTRLLKDLCRGSCSSSPIPFRPLGSTFYLSGSDGRKTQIWSSNGTAAGTARVTNLPRVPSDNVRLTGARAGDWFLFNGYDLAHGRELWRTTGSLASTSLLFDFPDPEP